MVHIDALLQYYPESCKNQKLQVYTEYLQYLIIKKIYNVPFGANLFLSGSFFNRIKFSFDRFDNTIDFVAVDFEKQDIYNLNMFIVEYLKLEGFAVTCNKISAGFKFKIDVNDDLFDMGDEEIPDIIIIINYFTKFKLLKNNDTFTGSMNINYLDVCTRINTIDGSKALTLIVKRAFISNSVSVTELFDLYLLYNRGYSLDLNFFGQSDQRNIGTKIIVWKSKLKTDLTHRILNENLIDKSIENYSDFFDGSWLQLINT